MKREITDTGATFLVDKDNDSMEFLVLLSDMEGDLRAVFSMPHDAQLSEVKRIGKYWRVTFGTVPEE
ncbi:MAG: hypothetical protein AB1817_11505 [Chloroflexota bacterium]